jgi:triacylglycerol lipase
MPKLLPPSTTGALSPPASSAFPYEFFENVAAFPFKPNDSTMSLQNAWWLMEAAFLSYSAPAVIEATFARPPLSAAVLSFSGPLSTDCYVASTSQWIVLAFRGTQVDNFWSSVTDWSVDARFLPAPDRHRDWVHEGFSAAVRGVWKPIVAHIASLQAAAPRPLWVTGHSLGAALATVAANLLCADQTDGLGIRGLYTYGSPRVGDNGFGRRITVPAYRFRHNTDLVTHVPLGLVFHHVGRLQFVDSGGSFHPDVGPAEELLLNVGAMQLSASQAQNLAALMRAAGQGVPLPGFLADHAPINYAIRIWNCLEAA